MIWQGEIKDAIIASSSSNFQTLLLRIWINDPPVLRRDSHGYTCQRRVCRDQSFCKRYSLLEVLQHPICYLFQKLELVVASTEFQKMIVQELKLFLVVCCNGWQGWKWIKTWKTFSTFNAIPAKITNKIIIVSAPWWNLLYIFFITLQPWSRLFKSWIALSTG